MHKLYKVYSALNLRLNSTTFKIVSLDYKHVWKNYPWTITWTAGIFSLIGFVTGALFV
jgi:hypothetical protein